MFCDSALKNRKRAREPPVLLGIISGKVELLIGSGDQRSAPAQS
jgi:hypothetical protein